MFRKIKKALRMMKFLQEGMASEVFFYEAENLKCKYPDECGQGNLRNHCLLRIFLLELRNKLYPKFGAGLNRM